MTIETPDHSNTQVDFCLSKRPDSRFNLWVEALNLIGSILSTHGRFEEALRETIDFHGTQTLSVRGSC